MIWAIVIASYLLAAQLCYLLVRLHDRVFHDNDYVQPGIMIMLFVPWLNILLLIVMVIATITALADSTKSEAIAKKFFRSK